MNSSLKCPNCGLVNWATAEACKRCQFAFTDAGGGHEAGGWQEESPGGFQSEPANEWGNDQAGYQGDYNQAGYQGAPYGYAPYQGQAPKTGLAIASMVTGIISLMACGLLGLGSITGLILGIVALKKTNKFPQEYGGKGFAVAGIVLSVVSFFYIGIVAAIAIPNLLASRRAANESAALRTLSLLSRAQETYRATEGNGHYGTLQELAAARLIDDKLARGGSLYRYVFEVKANGMTYEALATPAKDGDTSGRSFYLSSEEDFIRAAHKGGLAANSYDPPLKQYSASPSYEKTSSPGNAAPEYAPAY
jgi:type II secretory pathway pseudopilin PulG